MRTMNLLAALIAVAVGTAAHADSVNVNIYGKIRVGAEGVNDVTADSSRGQQFRVVDNSSRIGFKGAEDLGDGLSAIWQIESGLQADGDDNKGTEKDGRLNSRNTFLGLKGEWGTVLLGKHDTPYKQAKDYLDPFTDTTGEIAGILHRGAGQNFHTRQTSTLIYHSPEWNGVQFKLGLAPDEAKTTKKNSVRVSTSLGYKKDALSAAVAYERRNDAAGDQAAQAFKLTAGYSFDLISQGKTDVGLGLEQIKVDTKKRNAYFLAVNQKIGRGNVGLTYGQAGQTQSGAQDGAKQVTLGAGLQLSKRTELQAYYSTIRNDNKGNYNFSINSLDALSAGKDPRVLGFGISHTF